jgi:hypothetical protein
MRSKYTFFCSKDCAADWGDDEALVQSLAKRKASHAILEKVKKEKA